MIGGSKYPSKKRINLYHQQINKKAVVFRFLMTVFLVTLAYVCVYFFVIAPIKQTEHMEQLYQNMELQLEELRASNLRLDEISAEYAHYGDACLNEEEKQLPSRLRMLETLKTVVFPLCTRITSVSITGDKMEITCVLSNGAALSEVIRQIEADEAVRYVTASAETVIGDEENFAEYKSVNVQMTVYFNKF